MQNRMFAQFCLPAEILLAIIERDAAKTHSHSSVSVRPIGNGALCAATGPTQEIMGLIGAVADEGEDALYKAEWLRH